MRSARMMDSSLMLLPVPLSRRMMRMSMWLALAAKGVPLFLYNLLILHQSTDQTFLSWHISLITNLNNVNDSLDFCQTCHTFYPNIFYLRFDLKKRHYTG